MKLAVICPYFNPLNLKTRLNNFRRFYDSIKSPNLFVAELLYNNQKPKINADFIFHTHSILWHKENLINCTIEKIPDFDAYAWIDCDVIFHNDNWYYQTVNLLEKYECVQPFHLVRFLNEVSVVEESMYGYAFGKRYGEINDCWYTPGMAWAVRKKFTPLNDKCIVGGGDLVSVQSFQNFGYVEGVIDHLWHGSKFNRFYDTRINLLKGFDADKDLMYNEEGILEFNPNSLYIEPVKNYFINRKEDIFLKFS